MPAPCSKPRPARPSPQRPRCNRRNRTRRFSVSTCSRRLLAFGMPSVDHAGTTLFLKRWLRRPFAIGAVVPSGRPLAEAMAETTLANLDGQAGHVVEMGAGTGPVTRAVFDTRI